MVSCLLSQRSSLETTSNQRPILFTGGNNRSWVSSWRWDHQLATINQAIFWITDHLFGSIFEVWQRFGTGGYSQRPDEKTLSTFPSPSLGLMAVGPRFSSHPYGDRLLERDNQLLSLTSGYKRIFPYQETDPSAIIFHLFSYQHFVVSFFQLLVWFTGVFKSVLPILHFLSSFGKRIFLW